MKKIALIMAAAAAAATLLTGCNQKFTCDVCGEEQDGGKHVVEAYGETATLCDTCYGYFNIGMDAIENGDIDLGDFGIDY